METDMGSRGEESERERYGGSEEIREEWRKGGLKKQKQKSEPCCQIQLDISSKPRIMFSVCKTGLSSTMPECSEYSI